MLRALAVRSSGLRQPQRRVHLACCLEGSPLGARCPSLGLCLSPAFRAGRGPASRQALPSSRRLSSTSATTSAPSPPSQVAPPQVPSSILASYSGPLSKTFFRLKLFSLGSLTMVTALCPVLLLAPGTIGIAGRIGLCCTALATSGASTGLIAWIGKPYVGEMQLLSGLAATKQLIKDLPEGDDEVRKSALTREEKPVIQVMTTTWRLQRLQTTIYEPSLIRPTSRPFATWELPTSPPSLALTSSLGAGQTRTLTRLVATTRDVKSKKVVGRWWARWTRDTLSKGKESNEWKSEGQCTEEGKVIRHYSIHEDLLNEDWQVL